MQTSYLKYFVDVARLGSITAAADENFITPQGLSRSLSVLESELGCKLYNREGNRIALTRFGSALLEDARRVLAAQAEMFAHVSQIRSDEVETTEKHVNVYLNNAAFDTALFEPLIDSFDRIFSDARYFQCDNEGVVRNLIENSEDESCVQLGMLCLFSPDDERNGKLVEILRDKGFEYQPYIHSYDQVLVSAKSELAAKKALGRSDILSRPIVSSDGDIRRVAESLFGKSAIFMVTSDSAFRFRVVANDEAITFVPAFHKLTKDGDGLTAMVPMKDPYYLELGFVARKGVLASPYIKNVIAHMNDYYQKFADSTYLSIVPSTLSKITLGVSPDLADEAFFESIARSYALSKRETDVFSRLLNGNTAQPIAADLGVSLPTVKSHIYSIYKKAGVHSQKELIALVESLRP